MDDLREFKTGDEISVDLARGPRGHDIRLNGELLECVESLKLDVTAGVPPVVTLTLSFPHVSPQRGFLVAESEFREFFAWRMEKNRLK